MAQQPIAWGDANNSPGSNHAMSQRSVLKLARFASIRRPQKRFHTRKSGSHSRFCPVRRKVWGHGLGTGEWSGRDWYDSPVSMGR